jgi:hypothetical protein
MAVITGESSDEIHSTYSNSASTEYANSEESVREEVILIPSAIRRQLFVDEDDDELEADECTPLISRTMDGFNDNLPPPYYSSDDEELPTYSAISHDDEECDFCGYLIGVLFSMLVACAVVLVSSTYSRLFYHCSSSSRLAAKIL